MVERGKYYKSIYTWFQILAIKVKNETEWVLEVESIYFDNKNVNYGKEFIDYNTKEDFGLYTEVSKEMYEERRKELIKRIFE